MADGINHTVDLSNNLSRDQVKISTDNQSIFDRVFDVADWKIYRIIEYADDAIRTAI